MSSQKPSERIEELREKHSASWSNDDGRFASDCEYGEMMAKFYIRAIIEYLNEQWEAEHSPTSTAEVTPASHLVDCDADPVISYDGWTVEEHRKGGMVDVAKLGLYLSDKQKSGFINGTDLREELKTKPVLNANVLDYLMKHQELIPEEWKQYDGVFFWGTIYRLSGGHLCVRFLFWLDGQWRWCDDWLDSGWYSQDPALISA